MAEKAKPAVAGKPTGAKPADDKPRDLFAPVETGVDDNGLRWGRFEHPVLGQPYTVRETTVAEDDAAYDAAELPDDKHSPRLDYRLRVCSAIVSPPTTVDDITSWSSLKWRFIDVVFQRINSLPPADAEGNA